MTQPTTYDKWPPIGQDYEGYQTRHGKALTREDVIAAFTAKHGQAPTEVLWCKPKPGVWLAGPLPAPLAATDDGSSRPASPELAGAPGGAPPALEMARVVTAPEPETEMQPEKSLAQQSYEKTQQYALEQYWKRNAAEIEESLIDAGLLPDPDEQTEAAPVLDGQARLL